METPMHHIEVSISQNLQCKIITWYYIHCFSDRTLARLWTDKDAPYLDIMGFKDVCDILSPLYWDDPLNFPEVFTKYPQQNQVWSEGFDTE